MPKPYTYFWLCVLDVVIFTGNFDKGEREVMNHNQDLISDLHVAPKLNIIFLAC